ncbi:MAG: short-chain dehydrogenase/reductase, partial [Sphingomonas sp.]
PNPPRHLVLGKWGYDAVTDKLRVRSAEIEAHRDASLAADYPDA